MKLVDAHAVRELLNDNVDEHVSHYALFTDHGTLLSHDKSLTRASLTKFAPFAGTTWRNHNAQIFATGSTNSSVGGFPSVKTLSAKLNPDGNSLEQLTVEMDGVTSVMRLIIPRLLIAAQLENSRFEEKSNGVSARTGSAAMAANRDASSIDSGGVGEDSASLSESTISKSRSDGLSEEIEEPEVVEENEETMPSKMRILELKAEGMAEFLADAYPAKLPNDFY